jgi:hypothetical protein
MMQALQGTVPCMMQILQPSMTLSFDMKTRMYMTSKELQGTICSAFNMRLNSIAVSPEAEPATSTTSSSAAEVVLLGIAAIAQSTAAAVAAGGSTACSHRHNHQNCPVAESPAQTPPHLASRL